MPLEREKATYRKLLEDREHANEHHGEYVLIHGEEVCGYFSSYSDALHEGYDKFGLESFMVKQVSLVEQAHLITRFFDPCPTLLGR